METTAFRKILCANRGEIAIRVFRACTELGIRTVAIYSEEDRTHQHRYKADEAYLVGRGKKPIDAYMAIEEILQIAKRAHVDAIHPGYGFLSESAEFADACEREGIHFIGPRPDVLRTLGDKIQARTVAERSGVAIIPGMTIDLTDSDSMVAAEEFFDAHHPVMVKAAHGGGGRGMRVVREREALREAISQASSESRSAFGSPVVFLEKCLEMVRHIEVQILGDLKGNIVHLHERDCSVQRRHQKIIEIAPAPNLNEVVRQRLHESALKLARAVGYHNAGTVEFLVAGDEAYFIEVNPRLQVEHTVTEEVTGIDLVQAQIHVASGHSMGSEQIGIYGQSSIQTRGYAIQCRITTEDPTNNFMPDTGRLLAYRSAAGFGIRLDTGNGYAGALISPHYDSLLVKVTAHGLTYSQAIMKALRALNEFRIRGVKTNTHFLENVLRHDYFRQGSIYTSFIDDSRELYELDWRRDRGTKLLQYLGEVIVNGHPTIKPADRCEPSSFLEAPVPIIPDGDPPPGTVQILQEAGPNGLADWVLSQKRPLLTDTTMRDAHQSLLATRVRTFDLLKIAEATSHLAPELFSLETWGGATFDVAYRFLNEDPWDRLRKLKRAVPNILQQMLLRGANAVGYTSYPDNVVERFIEEAAIAGIDVFRVFDSLNDLDNMDVAVRGILKNTDKVAEVCICYTGDLANPNRLKYTLDYYGDLARRIEDMGAHMLCIKDMAGLLRPRAAQMLIQHLKETVAIPIHLHTHDTSGNGVAALMEAIRCDVDIVDVALAPMAGMTSQPSMNALVAALRGGERETGMGNKSLQPLADYWEVVRDYYKPFECGLKSGTSEVYYHEIPGGQYSNLRPQVASMGLLHRWNDVKHAFAVINALVGDIPKVTPSSKMVGDFAIFIVQNDLFVMDDDFDEMVARTKERLITEAPRLDFPLSVVTYFQGHLGQPPGGFPAALQEAILKGLPTVDGRPSDSMEPIDLEGLAVELAERYGRTIPDHMAISAALYPRVIADHLDFVNRHEDVSVLDTPTYFFGMDPGQEINVDLEPGKTLVISFSTVSEPDGRGYRTVYFEINGQGRQVRVRDAERAPAERQRRKVNKDDPSHVGAPMPGTVIAVHCSPGETIGEGEPLLTLEAMKMETVVRAPRTSKIVEVVPELKATVQADDLIAVLDGAVSA